MPDSSRDDHVTALALAAGRGDRRALEVWVRATQPDVWRFVAYLAGSGLADDLSQETYLRAFGSLRRFAGRSSSRTWLLSIARRVVVDHIRSARARPRIDEQRDDWEPAAEQHRGSTSGSERGFESLVEVKLLLGQLDEDRREALVLTQVLGLSHEEAAAVCGCPIGTVRSRVARARADLLDADREQHDGAI